jgi:hypothetical protein
MSVIFLPGIGVPIESENIPSTITYDANGLPTTITVMVNNQTFVKTYTYSYTNSVLTSSTNSGWVKQ